MNGSSHLRLRQFHAFRGKFTPRIRRKRIVPVLLPFSLKRIVVPPPEEIGAVMTLQ